MTSIARNFITNVGTTLQDLGANAYLGIKTGIKTGVNKMTEAFKASVSDNPMLQSGGRILKKMTKGVVGFGMKAAVKTSVRAFQADDKIAQYMTTLNRLTGSDELAKALHQAVPGLVAKVGPQLGSKEFEDLINDQSCIKMAECKLLEALVNLMEKAQNLKEIPDKTLVPFLLTQLLAVAAKHLNHPSIDEDELIKDLELVSKMMAEKVQLILKKGIGDVLIGNEIDKDNAMLKHAQALVKDTLKVYGINMDEEQKMTVANFVTNIAKSFLNDGLSKLAYTFNEGLFSLKDKLLAESDKKMDGIFADFCKNSAKDASEALCDNVIKHSSPTVNVQKNIFEGIFENLFQAILIGIGKLFGIIDNNGKVAPFVELATKSFAHLHAASKEAQETGNKEKFDGIMEETFQNLLEAILTNDSISNRITQVIENLTGIKTPQSTGINPHSVKQIAAKMKEKVD